MGRSRARRAATVVALSVTVAVLGAAEPAGAGNPWVRVPVPVPRHPSYLESVSCVDEQVCVAVGRYIYELTRTRTLIVRTDDGGVSWTRQRSPNPGNLSDQLESVSCTTRTDCTAVGMSRALPLGFFVDPLIVRTTDGVTWHSVGGLLNLDWAEAPLWGVDCSAPTRCHAVGSVTRTQRAPLVMRTTTGNFWHELPTPVASRGREHSLQEIDCITALACTAVGSYVGQGSATRALVMRTTDGKRLAQITAPSPPGSDLRDVSCTSLTACTAVGHHQAAVRSFVLRGVGTTWTRASTPHLSAFTMNGISCRSVNQCSAVGERGSFNTMLRTSDGITWASPHSESEKSPRRLTSVSCARPTKCIAVGSLHDSAFDPIRAIIMRET